MTAVLSLPCSITLEANALETAVSNDVLYM